MKYVMLILSTPKQAELSQEEQGAWYSEIFAWYEKWGASPRFEAGHQLQGPETAKTVRAGSVTDGPFMETKEVLGGYSLIDARAVRDASPAGYLGVVLGIQGLFLTASLRGDWTRLRRALRTGLLISVGTVGAYLLVLFAFQRANAGRVATLREVSILIGLLIARDRPGPQAWLGGALVVAGAFLAVE